MEVIRVQSDIFRLSEQQTIVGFFQTRLSIIKLIINLFTNFFSTILDMTDNMKQWKIICRWIIFLLCLIQFSTSRPAETQISGQNQFDNQYFFTSCTDKHSVQKSHFLHDFMMKCLFFFLFGFFKIKLQSDIFVTKSINKTSINKSNIFRDKS